MQTGGLKGEVQLVKWSPQTGTDVVSVVINNKSLLLNTAGASGAFVELNFESNYGNIVDYCYYKNLMIVIGFSKGYLVAVSTSKPFSLRQ